MTKEILSVSKLCYTYDTAEVLHEISLRVNEGELIGIIGPNGCGKSTAVKCIFAMLHPDSGNIIINNSDAAKMTHREISKQVAVVGQEIETEFDFTVKEVVAMGRYPYKKLFEADSREDFAIVDEAIKTVDMQEYRDTNFRHLSGGEKQRVLIARALAQKTGFLILDEPTNHLDIKHQLQIFETIREQKITTLAVMHDMNLASMFCDRIYVFKNGRNYADGMPKEIFTQGLIKDVFNVNSYITMPKCTGTPHPVFISTED